MIHENVPDVINKMMYAPKILFQKKNLRAKHFLLHMTFQVMVNFTQIRYQQ